MSLNIYLIAMSIFVMSTGGYMAMPLFPLLATSNGIPLTEVGILTALYIFAQKTLPIISGPLGDRMGYHRLAVMGEVIRGLGFIGIGIFQSFPILLFCGVLAGSGGGIASPSLNALIMLGSLHEERPKRSAIRTTALNAGLLIGPIIAGFILLNGEPYSVFVYSGLFYLLGSFLLFFVTQNSSRSMPVKVNMNLKMSYKFVLTNKPFFNLLLYLFIFWFLFSQLFVTIPALVNAFTKHIEIIFWINGIIGLILQYPIGAVISKKYNQKVFMIIGSTLFAFSFIALGAFTSFLSILAGVILFSIGECFMLPIIETMIADSASNDCEFGTYFGCAALSDGLGRPVGSVVGPFLLSQFGNETWFLFGVIALLLIVYQSIIFKTENSFTP